MAVSVVLVDDHTMLRQGLRRALESEGIDVLGEAADGDEGVSVALDKHPDVVLMDVSMPRTDGIEATRRLLAANGEMRVVMLTPEHLAGAGLPEIHVSVWGDPRLLTPFLEGTVPSPAPVAEEPPAPAKPSRKAARA